MRNYYAKSLSWSLISKIFNSIVGFLSVPFLIGHYGPENYGLIGIAMAANGYMHFMDMGLNTGAVRFYSKWRAEGEYDKLQRAAHSSMSIYAGIGIINTLLLIWIAFYGENLFSVTQEQFQSLKLIFLTLACFSIVNWISGVYQQLLSAYEQISFTMMIGCVNSLLKLILIYVAINCDFSIVKYNFYLSLTYCLFFIVFAYKCKQVGALKSLRLGFYWQDFKPLVIYSLSIFALSFFQMTASQSRPLILSIFTENGALANAEFKIVEVFPSFVISMAGMFSAILLPKASAMDAKKDRAGMERMAYDGTFYTSLSVCLLAFPVLLNSVDILTLYVGETYTYLNTWTIIMICAVLVYLHSSPCSSLYLATGKTKEIVLSTIVNCVVSIVINISLCLRYGVGSAVIGYAYYVTAQTLYQYTYIYKRLLGLSPQKVFISYMKPVSIGVIITLVFLLVNRYVNCGLIFENKWMSLLFIAIKCIPWYVAYIFVLHFIGWFDLKEMYHRFIK